jgi:hypothetical protein
MANERLERRRVPRADDPEMRGRRAEPRAYLVLPASTEALSGNRHVTLLDVSRTGARVAGQNLPDIGKEVVLNCGGIEAFGSVVWAAPDRRGIHFEEPIGGRDLIALRALAAESKDSEMTYEEREAAADWSSGLAR